MRTKLYRGRYYAVWTDPVSKETRRHSLRTADREEADRRLIDFKRIMDAPTGSLVRDYVRAYLNYKQGRVADHVRLEGAWKNAEPTFGHLRPDQITPELCERYAKARRIAGRSDGTVLKEINVIRQAMNWNKVRDARFEAPSAPPPRDRYLTKDEARRLREACKQPHVRLYVWLALATAARRGALLSLTWDRVDFERKQIDLREPSEVGRKKRAIIKMNTQIIDVLIEAKKAAQTSYVIEYAGKQVGNIKKGFLAAVARAGLEDVTPHDLRHTAAVWMVEGGTPMDQVSQYLGHSSTRVTESVYARFSPDYLSKAAETLVF